MPTIFNNSHGKVQSVVHTKHSLFHSQLILTNSSISSFSMVYLTALAMQIFDVSLLLFFYQHNRCIIGNYLYELSFQKSQDFYFQSISHILSRRKANTFRLGRSFSFAPIPLKLLGYL